MPLPARSLRVACLLLAGTALLSAPAEAQQATVPQISMPVVQAVPGEQGMRLNAALARLARNPQDVEALLDAGKASLGLGDVQAAIGFYQRAAALAPGNGRVKAGLAGAYVLSEDPFTAIPLFDEAALAGPIDPDFLADRGLAYDLVGDNATAQTYYRQALAGAPSDEALRRLALSQAIAGDRKGMDLTLSPLLQRQDKAAWRTRAFGLAILGNTDEAEAITRQTMPAHLAGSIAAYLRYMPRLTPAQQAAAANLGHFPRAAEIGRDDPRVAQYVRPRAVVAAATPAPAPRNQAGERSARSTQPDRASGRERGKAQPRPSVATPVNAAPPEPKVGREVDGKPVQVAVAPPQVAQPVARPTVSQAEPAKPSPAAPPASPGFATVEPGAGGNFKLQSTIQAQQSAPAPAPASAAPQPPVAQPPAAPSPPRRPTLDEAFAEFSPPSRDAATAAGAVDMRKIKPAAPTAAGKDKADPAKDKGKEAKAPPKPSHPSRIWVQVATGRDKKALAFDWNRMVKAEAAAFKGRKGFTSAWGQTNRLLTGPFESESAAKAFLAQLRKTGVDGAFLWISPAGQVVDVLAASR